MSTKDNLAFAWPDLVARAVTLFDELQYLPESERIDAINRIRLALSTYSPFNAEPVDCVQWVKAESVQANDYNPNSVAPPEMQLLALSIMEDGYTQPIVAWEAGDKFEVVDGFHRNRVGRENEQVKARIKGYLPIVAIKEDRLDRGDRIASTIRHNRARGKHAVAAMSEIVVELKRRNWSPQKIGKELGMDQDEVLRLCQISGLTEMFADKDFSEAWEAEILDDHAERIDSDLSPILEVGGSPSEHVGLSEGPAELAEESD